MTMTGPARRTRFKIPAEWEQEFREGYAHYQDYRTLERILQERFRVRPAVMHTTRDFRGVVTLTLPELYWLIYVPEDQPRLVCTGAKITAQAQPGQQRGSAREVQHAAEVAEMRELLANEFGIFPESMVPTSDMKGRVRLHFDELQKIIQEDSDVQDILGE